MSGFVSAITGVAAGLGCSRVMNCMLCSEVSGVLVFGTRSLFSIRRVGSVI